MNFYELDTSVCVPPKDPRNPHGGAARGQRKRRERTERPTEKRKRNNQTTKAKKKTGTRRTNSEVNNQTHTPQREETSHVQPRHKHARTSKEASHRITAPKLGFDGSNLCSEEKKEQRGEGGVQVNPRQTHYRRITEGLRKCIPNYSERKDNTGTT